jgi:hypothetical protein
VNIKSTFSLLPRSTEMLSWLRRELLGVFPIDLPRVKEQTEIWPVVQERYPIYTALMDSGELTLSVLTKENTSTIDYFLITILLHILYL